jgi:hypothetical protein
MRHTCVTSHSLRAREDNLMSERKARESTAEQFAMGRGSTYWLIMIIIAFVTAGARHGCFDGTHDAKVNCRSVPEFQKSACVQCVKSGGTWVGGMGVGECRPGRK